MADHADLENRFAYHPATGITGPQHSAVRERCFELAQWLSENTPPGRHQSLALTAVEEAMHWANAAIACDAADPT